MIRVDNIGGDFYHRNSFLSWWFCLCPIFLLVRMALLTYWGTRRRSFSIFLLILAVIKIFESNCWLNLILIFQRAGCFLRRHLKDKCFFEISFFERSRANRYPVSWWGSFRLCLKAHWEWQWTCIWGIVWTKRTLSFLWTVWQGYLVHRPSVVSLQDWINLCILESLTVFSDVVESKGINLVHATEDAQFYFWFSQLLLHIFCKS